MDNRDHHYTKDDQAQACDAVLSDRRLSDRYRSVCRIGRVRRQHDVGLWRVRNISDEGMMLAANVPVMVGEQVEIALSESVEFLGKVIWADNGHCGIAFSQKIDAVAMLRELAVEQSNEGYRALRLPVEVKAIVALRNESRLINLVDISQSGAGFLYDTPLEPGTELELVLPGDEHRRRALVRWSRGLRGGLWFSQPLDRTELESIARFQT